jgi:hypothetical protein
MLSAHVVGVGYHWMERQEGLAKGQVSARNKFSTVCAFSYALWRKKIDVHEALGRELAPSSKKRNIQPCTDINIYFLQV